MAGYKLTKTHVVSETGEASIITGREGLAIPTADTYLTVGQVEKLTGIKESRLRHYDRIGLLCPARSGERIANNRKLYGVEDLARLQAIVTLSAYQFSLEEIKAILDDGISDIEALIQTKIKTLKRQEGRLHALVLFTKFIELSETDLIEGLANGPADLDELADLVRDTPLYEAAIQRLENYGEEEASEQLRALDAILDKLIIPDEALGFTCIEEAIDQLFHWWDGFVLPLEESGYFGFWAIFEDHALVPEYIETIGEAGDAGFIEMYAFFVLLKRYLCEQQIILADIAQLAKQDIVLALEEAYDLVAVTSTLLFGTQGAQELSDETLIETTTLFLFYAMGVLEDQKLTAYLRIPEDVRISETEETSQLTTKDILEQTLRVLDITL